MCCLTTFWGTSSPAMVNRDKCSHTGTQAHTRPHPQAEPCSMCPSFPTCSSEPTHLNPSFLHPLPHREVKTLSGHTEKFKCIHGPETPYASCYSLPLTLCGWHRHLPGNKGVDNNQILAVLGVPSCSLVAFRNAELHSPQCPGLSILVITSSYHSLANTSGHT